MLGEACKRGALMIKDEKNKKKKRIKDGEENPLPSL